MSRPGGKRRVLVAPDKFRGTATAPQAARWPREGLGRHLPPGLVTAMPVADGGEGTIDCFAAAGPPEVAALERGLQTLSQAVAAVPGQGHAADTATGSGGGAGGGVAWALETVLGARRASVAETILDLIGFDRPRTTRNSSSPVRVCRT